ncbi:MAG: PhoH family protein [Candidatus Erginobacter occultus]|nr:PhoH family protein [Candidatus Erginobacter occultus]
MNKTREEMFSRGDPDYNVKATLNFSSPELVRDLFVRDEKNLRFLEEAFGVRAVARDNFIRLSGPAPAVKETEKLLRDLSRILEDGESLAVPEFRRLIRVYSGEARDSIDNLYGEKIEVDSHRGFVRPRTVNQRRYVEAIRGHDVTFSIGPAGTGKTYLAMALAVSALLKGEVKRLILTRPALEAGEKLGFLPGDLYQKISPYLRPLYDALYDLMDAERIRKYEEDGVIEVAPLAFMRGRTLNNAFIILDEAQNTTPEQMKMFLTRLGFNSRAVITGDVTQIDLPSRQTSGLKTVREILKGIREIPFIQLTREDVIRHPLVAKIVRAYEKAEQPGT